MLPRADQIGRLQVEGTCYRRVGGDFSRSSPYHEQSGSYRFVPQIRTEKRTCVWEYALDCGLSALQMAALYKSPFV